MHPTSPLPVRAAAALPVALALAVFLPAVVGAGWVADDAVNLSLHAHEGDLLGEWTTPTYAHAGSGKGHIWRPIPATLQHLVALAFGRSAGAFRVLNVALHVGNIALLQWLCRRRGASVLGAAVLALFFAVHPVTPDAVCWSSDVYDLAATTAVLGTLGVALARTPLAARAAGVALLTLVAGLCKESAVAVVPVVGIAVGLGRDGWRGGLALAAASGLGAAAYLGAHGAITAQSYAAAAGATPLADQLIAGLGAASWLTPRRFAGAPMAHLFDPAERFGPALGALTLAGFGVAATAMWGRDRRAALAALAAGAAWALLLAPAAIGIPLIGVQAVRYAYLPLAATVLLAASGDDTVPGRGPLAFAVAFAALGLVHTLPRTHDFLDDGTLWGAELAAEPDNPYAAGSLARWLLKTGEDERALALWARAVDAAPAGLKVFDRDHERWLLAQAAFLRGRPDIALVQVTAHIDSLTAQGRPVPGNAWCLQADSLDRLGRPDDAAAAALRCAR